MKEINFNKEFEENDEIVESQLDSLNENYEETNYQTSDPQDSLQTLNRIVPLLLELQCKALVAINVSGRHERAQFFVIVTILSFKHSKKVIESLNKLRKELKTSKSDYHNESNDPTWSIFELMGVQVHLLDSDVRNRLSLEKLWIFGKYDDELHEMLANPIQIIKKGISRSRVKYVYEESQYEE